MRHLPILLAGLLAFGPCLPASANPLAAPPANPPAVAGEAAYAGHFADATLELTLRANGPGFYNGEIRRNSEIYPLQAELRAGALHGSFRSGQESFPFTAVLQGDSLALETGGARYSLARQGTDNPLAAPGGPPPLAPPAPAIPEAPTVSADPGALMEEFHPLAEQVGNEFQSFIGTLRQWLSANDSQADSLVQQQLLPLSLSLNAKLGRLSAVAGQMANVVALKQGESEVLQELAKTSHSGAEYMSAWHGLLSQMLELNSRGELPALQKLAGERLPPAVQNTLALAKKLAALLAVSRRIQSVQANPANKEAATLNPSKLLKLESLRNMSEMMRDGMSILKDMRQK